MADIDPGISIFHKHDWRRSRGEIGQLDFDRGSQGHELFHQFMMSLDRIYVFYPVCLTSS